MYLCVFPVYFVYVYVFVYNILMNCFWGFRNGRNGREMVTLLNWDTEMQSVTSLTLDVKLIVEASVIGRPLVAFA